jgi:hypothetical protein
MGRMPDGYGNPACQAPWGSAAVFHDCVPYGTGDGDRPCRERRGAGRRNRTVPSAESASRRCQDRVVRVLAVASARMGIVRMRIGAV